ncbi:MAG: M23 family metallopeptidase [Anaerolineales bacterium]|nr:M23 family metallopeptidase [Anaerolineales bacterium]
MQKEFKEETPTPTELEKQEENLKVTSIPQRQTGNVLTHGLNLLAQMGLGEALLRGSTNLFSAIAIILVLWLAQAYFQQTPYPLTENTTQVSGPTPSVDVNLNAIPALDNPAITGIARSAQLHTNIPSRPRNEISMYTVQAGDTVSGIAEKFGLLPETIFAANYAILQDDPHSLVEGQELQILPVDGVYWQWLGGISFGAWADYFQVKPEDIINYPANNIDASNITDPANADIKPGVWLVIPGAKYSFHQPGSIPLGITRTDPASAQVGGSGACGAISGGAVGTGSFIFPTGRHNLSGFDYTPKTNHLGIDLAGDLGDPIYASDGGVIVYAGANSYGYGNMVMVDHGTGFQTLYAHMSLISVSCGESVNQGQYLGAVGSTGKSSGPHLHFEVRTSSTVINPWDVLPNP